ncbi:MAG TPA: pinensin family lanthipeptide [Longimicrobium sp.]|jgi:hypothetical protein|uniref:pinensin family lanthipeptide n=1 Tax=Longimicrobium sp. TaxID=2029185 RepID=UPI002EDA3D04
MKKLNISDLEVESFATAENGARLGTVMGMQESLHSCPQVGCETIDAGCETGGCDPTFTAVHTCEPTCADGCHLSLGGDPAEFTCNPQCLSYYTNCHRCTFWT